MIRFAGKVSVKITMAINAGKPNVALVALIKELGITKVQLRKNIYNEKRNLFK